MLVTVIGVFDMSFPSKIEEEVRDKIHSLLQRLLQDSKSPEGYEVILSELTRMAILGTAPPASRPKTFHDDFSASKESWIAR